MTYVPPTFDSILELLNDTTKTRYQLAADIHAMISRATAPSALNIKPVKERKKREPRAPKTGLVQNQSGLVQNGADDHGEAH